MLPFMPEENKKPRVYVASLIEEETRDRLREYADGESRTFSDYVRLTLETHVARREEKQAKTKKRRASA
jgi:hypothetical protein